MIRGWLRVSVVERSGRMEYRTTESRDAGRGIPQGGVISPLLANLYFRRLVLAWRLQGHQNRLDARIVNYADDYAICCRPGRGAAANAAFSKLAEQVGLQVNQEKTRVVNAERGRFDFLGYTIGCYYGRRGRPYTGTRPSRKAVSRLLRRIRFETSRRWYSKDAESRVEELNRLLRGWSAYFNQGPVLHEYGFINQYVGRRLRRWLVRKHRQQGHGYRRYPDQYLHEELGLIKLPTCRADLPRAKA